MGDFLQKLGAFAFAHKWWVITAWIVIIGGLGFVASQFYQPPSSAISIPGTQA